MAKIRGVPTLKVTIRDVAQAAGVAPATVSNYLNDSAPVSEAARKKIGDAIARLNYRPTVRSVVPSRNAMEIALFVPEAFEDKDRMYLDETFLDLLRGVGEQLRQSGSRLTLLWHKQLPDIEREIIGSGAIGGVIYPSPHVDDPIPGLLLDNDVPLVTLGELSNRTDYHSVDMDNIAGAQMATRHLIELGHTDIAFIAPCPLDTMLSFYRLTGYQRAMTLSGLPLRPSTCGSAISARRPATGSPRSCSRCRIRPRRSWPAGTCWRLARSPRRGRRDLGRRGSWPSPASTIRRSRSITALRA